MQCNGRTPALENVPRGIEENGDGDENGTTRGMNGWEKGYWRRRRGMSGRIWYMHGISTIEERQPGKPSRTDGQSICAGMIKNKKAILGRARTHREVLVLGRKQYWWGRLVHRFEKRQGNGAFSSKLERIPLFHSCFRGLRYKKDTVLLVPWICEN
ncbi:hypothetical protein B9Z19DRAFT_488838 [Tuber borchii]|uniref:Uncharacterized protein n=1 Tax=Tuber borchii TaxID=42251 RepID=A0A2T6ZF49_TUBBO|nr:hypothetical protein B9Z19DRAFT_488838 [Tuber borchii]